MEFRKLALQEMLEFGRLYMANKSKAFLNGFNCSYVDFKEGRNIINGRMNDMHFDMNTYKRRGSSCDAFDFGYYKGAELINRMADAHLEHGVGISGQ